MALMVGGNMAEQFTGRVQVQSEDDGLTTIILNGNSSDVLVGGAGHAGAVIIRDDAGADRVKIRPQTITVFDDGGQIVIQLDGPSGDVQFGANGARGQITVHNGEGVATILIGGGEARIELGASGKGGSVHVKNDEGQETIKLTGNANMLVGGGGANGDIFLFRDDGDSSDTATATIHADGQGANLFLGGQGAHGGIWLFPGDGNRTDTDTASIHLAGSSGDIILQNADVAEDFDVREPEAIEPGMVVVIGDDSMLRISSQSYDKRVAGVISGNGSPRPGIILGRHASSQSRLPVALIGRVHCRVDATTAPIMIGDLLTTSATPGHAMKADDYARAHGAIIGKALQCQPEGTGTIPILVALQ
jgi:hypothetical protein